jgi:colanic acid/amylovoran biosynthesis glycosyltransferase
MYGRKLAIGIIIPQFPSYTETFFLSQVIGLCKKGHDVKVFCSEINQDKNLFDSNKINSFKNLHIQHLDSKNLLVSFIPSVLAKPFHLFEKWDKKKSTLRRALFNELCKYYFLRHKCDVYHFGYSGIALAFSDLFDVIAGKKIISCLGTAENVKTVTEMDRKSKLISIFQKTDLIHAVSYDMKDKIEKLKVAPGKIFVNHPAVDTDYFKYTTSNRSGSTPITILSVGRLVFQKGFMIGLKAIEVLAKKNTVFKWMVIGDGPEREELLFNINLLNLDGCVTLAGRKTKEEIKGFYEKADIFFLPSVTEGMANVVLEAMSMQLPVVSSDCGGMPEVIQHEENGMLCENYNFKQMGEALFQLYIDSEK